MSCVSKMNARGTKFSILSVIWLCRAATLSDTSSPTGVAIDSTLKWFAYCLPRERRSSADEKLPDAAARIAGTRKSMPTQIADHVSIDPKAEIGDDVVIGPFCVIGPNVRIGNG